MIDTSKHFVLVSILMSKSNNKGVQGFTSILPLFVVALLAISGLAVYSRGSKPSTVSNNVLSESDKGSEKSGISEQTKNEIDSESEKDEAPEPKLTAEPEETPEPDEFEEENEIEVKDGTSKSKIKITNNKNKFEFQQEGTKFSIESDFPLSVNPTTRELTVTTPAGSSTVTILPQQVIDNMLASGIVTTTTGVDLKTESDGSLSYNIEGAKNEKLLGIFDVAVPKNLIVSAETGQVLTVNQSTFSKILDFLSI